MTYCRRYQHSSLIAESTSVYITIPKEEAFSFGLGCKSSIAHRTKTNKGYFYLKLLAICDLLTIVWTVPQELIIKVVFVGIQALCCTICATLDCSRARDPSCLQWAAANPNAQLGKDIRTLSIRSGLGMPRANRLDCWWWSTTSDRYVVTLSLQRGDLGLKTYNQEQ